MSNGHPFWDTVHGRVEPPPCAKSLGWTVLEAKPGAGAATLRFEAKPEFANPSGKIQDGFLAAMLDDAASAAIATVLEANEFSPTLE